MAVTNENKTSKKTANNKLTQNKNNPKGGGEDFGHLSHPKMMVYPSARGTRSITGDTLLIKCLEYIPPQTTSQYKYRLQFAKEKGKLGDQKYDKGDLIRNSTGGVKTTIAGESFKMINRGASDNINAATKGKQEKTIFFVELPIPQDVTDNNSVTWGDDNMNVLQLAGLALADKALNSSPTESFDEAKNLLTKGIMGQKGLLADEGTKRGIVAALTGRAFDSMGANINANSALGRATGQTLNSNLELLFDSVNLRTFPFNINFSPRTPDEAMTVKHIIRAFKSRMAAKKGTKEAGGQGGIFLKAPDVFQLKYLHRGKEHPFLNSFKHCALTGMTVNYTGAGTFATYEDGTPVNMKMSLTFKELNPIYFEDYNSFNPDDNQGVGF